MKLRQEILVGLTALTALITFIIFMSWLGSFRFGGEGYSFKVEFKDVNGLLEGGPVLLRGVKVGRVEKLTATPDKVIVEAWIKLRSTRIPKDSLFSIGTKGIIGEKYLAIMPRGQGENPREYISAGDTLIGKDPSKLEDLIASGQEVLADLKQLSANLNETLGDPQTREALKSMIKNLEITSKNLANATHEINKFTQDPENAKNLSESIKNFNASMEKANKVLTDIDKITGDPEVTKGVKESIKSLGSLGKTLGGMSLSESRFHMSLLNQSSNAPPTSRARPDLGISLKNQLNQTLDLELTDVGRGDSIQAQIGTPWGETGRIRLGIIDSRLGIGADYLSQDKRWQIGASMSDPVTPQGLINILYWIAPTYAFQLEYRNNFSTGLNSFAGGIRYSP